MAALDPVIALADAASGFVWRRQTEDGNATAARAFGWDAAGRPGVITNMSGRSGSVKKNAPAANLDDQTAG